MRRSEQKGFTMLEVLIVVGLTVVLMGVSMVAVGRYQKGLALMEMDQTAKELFLAAQEHLAVAGTQRKLDDGAAFSLLQLRAGSGASAVELGTDLPASGGSSAASNEYVVFVMDGQVQGGGSLDALLPRAAIDEYAKGQSFAIHYDRATYRVLDVFYTDRSVDLKSALTGYVTDTSAWSDLRDEARSKDRKDLRLADGTSLGVMGFYEDVEIQIPTPSVQNGGIALEVVDGPILYAVITIDDAYTYTDLSLVLNNDEINKLTIDTSDTSLNAELSATPRWWKLRSGRASVSGTRETTLTDYVVILDDLGTSSYRFGSLYPSMGIDPGSTLTLQAKAKVDGRDRDSGSPWTGSSLFSENSASATDVQISNFRHLQNLGMRTLTTDLSATLSESLYWNTYLSKVADLRDKIGKDVANMIRLPLGTTNDDYVPPTISYDIQFDGNGKSINGLTVDTTASTAPANQAPAGVFGAVEVDSASSVSSLDIRNAVIQGRDDAGILIGSVSGMGVLTVSDVDINGTQVVKSETGAAGGLIGKTDTSVTISGNVTASGVTVTATNGAAGGLIGDAGMTMDTVTLSDGIVVSTARVQGSSAAGGLIGIAQVSETDAGASDVSVRNSTVEASNGVAGGLIGEAKSGSTVTLGKVDVQNGTVTATNGAAGGVIGKAYSGIEIKDQVTVSGGSATATGGAAGGVIGNADASVDMTGGAVSVSGVQILSSDSEAGGVIGVCNVTGSSEVQLSDVTIDGASPSVRGAKAAGGVIGKTSASVTTGKVTASGVTVTSDTDAAGGVIGDASRDITISGDVSVSGGSVTATSGTGAAGGVVGDASADITISGDVSVSGVTVHASGAAGGVVGRADANAGIAISGDVTASGVTVTSDTGAAGGVFGDASRGVTISGAVSVSGGSVTATNGAAGGIFGAYSGNSAFTGLTISGGPAVTGGTAAGGVFGSHSGTGSVYGLSVSNAQIESTASGGAAGGVFGTYSGGNMVYGLTVTGGDIKATNGAAGGAFGTIVGAGTVQTKIGAVSNDEDDTIKIKDVSVSGGTYAGGLAGSVTDATVKGVLVHHSGGASAYAVYKNYMVTASTGAAGGLIGSASDASVEECAASVLVQGGSAAGGLIGSASGTVTISKISKSYAGGHTDPDTTLDASGLPKKVQYPASEDNVTATAASGTAGRFLGSASGSVTIAGCYTTATAADGFVGAGSVTVSGDTYDGTAPSLDDASAAVSGLKPGSDLMIDENDRTDVSAAPYDRKLNDASDKKTLYPFPTIASGSFWFTTKHIGDWWPDAAANPYTVEWRTPTAFASRTPGSAYVGSDAAAYNVLSDGSALYWTDIVKNGQSVSPPTLDMNADRLRLDYQLDYWFWYDLRSDGTLSDGTTQYRIENDGSTSSLLSRIWDILEGVWKAWTPWTAPIDGKISAPTKVTGNMVLYAHAKKDPSVVELRGYRLDEHGNRNTVSPAYIEYPEQVDISLTIGGTTDTYKRISFKTPVLGGYEIVNSGSVTWYYKDAAGEHQIETTKTTSTSDDGSDPAPGKAKYLTDTDHWIMIVPEGVEYLYADYAKIQERKIFVLFTAGSMRLRQDPFEYTFAKNDDRTLTVELPENPELANYYPRSVTAWYRNDEGAIVPLSDGAAERSMDHYGQIRVDWVKSASETKTFYVDAARTEAEKQVRYVGEAPGDTAEDLAKSVADGTRPPDGETLKKTIQIRCDPSDALTKYYYVDYIDYDAIRTQIRHVVHDVAPGVTAKDLTDAEAELGSDGKLEQMIGKTTLVSYSTDGKISGGVIDELYYEDGGVITAVEDTDRDKKIALTRRMADLTAILYTDDDGRNFTGKDTFTLRIPGYAASDPVISMETYQEGGMTKDMYVLTIDYTRRTTTLYYDLNGGLRQTVRTTGSGDEAVQTIEKSESGMAAVRRKAGTSSGTKDDVQKTTSDSGTTVQTLVWREYYKPVGWRLVDKDAYDTASAAQLTAWRTFGTTGLDAGVTYYNRSADNKAVDHAVTSQQTTINGRDAYGVSMATDIPMPLDGNKVAILVWEPVSDKATVTVRVYLQKRTDAVDAVEKGTQGYDYLDEYQVENVSVGDYYALNRNMGLSKSITDKNASPWATVNGVGHYLGTDFARVTTGSGRNIKFHHNVYFKLDQNRSDMGERAKIVPGENVINLYYDRAKIKLDISNVRQTTTTDEILTASALNTAASKEDTKWFYVSYNLMGGNYYLNTSYTATGVTRSGDNTSYANLTASYNGHTYTSTAEGTYSYYNRYTYVKATATWTEYTAYTGALDPTKINWWADGKAVASGGTFGVLNDDGTVTPLYLSDGSAPTQMRYEWRDTSFYKKGGESLLLYEYGNTYPSVGLYQGDLDFKWPTNYGLNRTSDKISTPILTAYYYQDRDNLFNYTEGTETFTIGFESAENNNSGRMRYYLEKDGLDSRKASQRDEEKILKELGSGFKNYFPETADISVPIPANDPLLIDRYIGYTFIAYQKNSGTLSKPTSSNISLNGSDNVNLYNIRQSYTVKFLDAAEKTAGSGVLNDRTYLYKEWITQLPDASQIVHKDRDADYQFLGWSEDGVHLVTGSDGRFLDLARSGVTSTGENYYSMPANSKVFIAVWDGDIDVTLTFPPMPEETTDETDPGGSGGETGGTDEPASLSVTVQVPKYQTLADDQDALVQKIQAAMAAKYDEDHDKYEAYKGYAGGSESKGYKYLSGIRWYANTDHTTFFDCLHDPVIGTGRALPLYGVPADTKETIKVPIYYQFTADENSAIPSHWIIPKMTTEHPTIVTFDQDPVPFTIDTENFTTGDPYTCYVPYIISLTEKIKVGDEEVVMENIYQLDPTESSVRSGEADPSLAETGLTFRYKLFTEPEWEFKAVTYLEVDGTYLRIDEKTEQGAGRQILYLPSDLPGLRLNASHAAVQVQVKDDGSVESGSVPEVGIVYQIDTHNIRFSNESWSGDHRSLWPRVYAYFSADVTDTNGDPIRERQLPLYLYMKSDAVWTEYTQDTKDPFKFDPVYDQDQENKTQTEWVLGADYAFKSGSDTIYTVSETYGVGGDGNGVTTTVSQDVTTDSDVWVTSDGAATAPWIKDGKPIVGLVPGSYTGEAEVWVAKKSGSGADAVVDTSSKVYVVKQGTLTDTITVK